MCEEGWTKQNSDSIMLSKLWFNFLKNQAKTKLNGQYFSENLFDFKNGFK